MALADKTLTCRECKSEFIFSAREQEFYVEKGFRNEPTRCKACRQARKASMNDRVLYDTVCAACGRQTQVPFEPRAGRPVYCRDCFVALRA